MPISDEFLEYVIDQLSEWNEVSPRKMFGGAGLYVDGVMFGLIADDVAYLKVDDSNRAAFENAEMSPLKPFDHKPMVMPYHEIPPEVLESPMKLARWSEDSLAAARRSVAAKAPKNKRPTKS